MVDYSTKRLILLLFFFPQKSRTTANIAVWFYIILSLLTFLVCNPLFFFPPAVA